MIPRVVGPRHPGTRLHFVESGQFTLCGQVVDAVDWRTVARPWADLNPAHRCRRCESAHSRRYRPAERNRP